MICSGLFSVLSVSVCKVYEREDGEKEREDEEKVRKGKVRIVRVRNRISTKVNLQFLGYAYTCL